MAHGNIILDVSGRKFRTSKSVLSVSPYFENLLTRWEDGSDLQADGSYFIYADADTFEHLLNFMRRPSRYPLYWTKKDGYDYALHCRVEAEADYFMLEGLRDWIKQKQYLLAVTVYQRVHSGNERPNFYHMKNEISLEHIAVADNLFTVVTMYYFNNMVLVNDTL